MFKVLIFSNLFPNSEEPLRGNFIASLVEEMAKLAKITVVSPLPWSSKAQNYMKWQGIDIYYPKYPFIPVLGRFIHPALVFLSVSGLVRRLIKEKHIDIINAHWVYPDGIAAVLIGRSAGVPVVVTAHGCDINLYGEYRLRRPQIKWALKNAAKVTAVSNPLAEKIVTDLCAYKEKVNVLHNGIDLKHFHFRNQIKCRKELGLDLSKKHLLFVGQLVDVKGLEYLIEALSIIKTNGRLDFQTLLIGEGPLRNRLYSLISEKGLKENVLLLGSKQYSEIPIWMGASNMLCLPSKREGQPCVILEALNCGIPVVASRVGGIPDMIDEDNGIMTDPGNVDELSEAIVAGFDRAWDRDRVASKVQQMTWVNSARKYVDIFSEILSGNKDRN